MNVLLISQCSKRALVETRRILDQFAERHGDRTWQTPITQQGLDTLRQLLKKTARRNTAVACHWIRGRDHTELLWIVGNAGNFNENGAVPTNSTERDILRSGDENNWHTAHAISILAEIAGLFHDFGKANKLFQEKLKPNSKLRSEPYRHEWVSLRLFEAFVGKGTDDRQWLEKLATVTAENEPVPLKDSQLNTNNPFKDMPSLAKVVGWLIVSHHRLPKFDVASEKNISPPSIGNIDEWMTGKKFKASWNSPQCSYDDWKDKDWKDVWEFKYGTPIRSKTWRDKAQSAAKRALQHQTLFDKDWLQDRFSSHLARLTLMLADHCYSSGEAKPRWQDPTYKAYANTDRKTKEQKQKLDEHNVGVGYNAYKLAQSLPTLRQTLPSITRHKGFKQRSTDVKFSWQDKAYELAKGVSKRIAAQGFFGINMASTGCGKTFANARIMYGLADEKLGCRFSVALGLRTLTLQTGDAMQARLKLHDEDMAVLIGSQAVRELHELRKQDGDSTESRSAVPLTAEQSGSESAAEMFDDFQYVRYDGSLDDGRLSHWLKESPKLHKLLSAPVLVSTIDHLMPATEGERGGKQIAPMLRLLTSDLVLDEPDDFDLADLPALSRLVNWAGMLGSRVLLSSATLPPALIRGLFDAYLAGRRQYQQACGDPASTDSIVCAWFDEFGVSQSDHADPLLFNDAHVAFVEKRIGNLQRKPPLRHAELLTVTAAGIDVQNVATVIAETIQMGMTRLHAAHHQEHTESGKRVSIGLVRMANINPMVAVARQVLRQTPAPDHRIHFCIYHSHHPLAVRSNMEEVLDAALTRHDESRLWKIPAIKKAIAESTEKNHLFVVFATSVAEVGRDHDYDWAIAEPSSMRSLIQLAGRIQRHRQKQPTSPNLLILNKNFKALQGAEVAYAQPGFEAHQQFILRSKNLADVLRPEQYQFISAIPRIRPSHPLDKNGNLADLEHAHLEARLFGALVYPTHASLWWKSNATWNAELQRRDPFRKASIDEHFLLHVTEEDAEPIFHLVAESGEVAPVEKDRFSRIDIQFADGVQPWMQNDIGKLLERIAERTGLEIEDASRKFSELRLRKPSEATTRKWLYDPLFGVHSALD